MEDDDVIFFGNVDSKLFGLRSVLTFNPNVGGAFYRSPSICGLAGVQALILDCDSVNVESPALWCHHDTLRKKEDRKRGGGRERERERGGMGWEFHE